MSLTSLEKQKAFVERKKAQGLKLYRNFWGPDDPEIEALARKYIANLQAMPPDYMQQIKKFRKQGLALEKVKKKG